MEKQITKAQFITWIITIVIFLIGLISSTYISISHRIKTLEITVHSLDLKYNQHEKTLLETRSDMKEIKTLLYNIDKKVGINEEKLKK